MHNRQDAKVILFFIDGLGIGFPHRNNPLSEIKGIEPLANFVNSPTRVYLDGILKPTDPRLGVAGRPQSASGQTTILTGINAPQILGYHKQGFPNEKLSYIIRKHSVFLQLRQKGIEEVVFANAYTPQFFVKTPRWKSATTIAVEAAGLTFRQLSDLHLKKALYHDFTNRLLREKGFNIELFEPAEAAAVLADLSAEHRFLLYEHFLTDKIGHAQDWQWAKAHLPSLAELIRKILQLIDLEKTTFILTSDHGNLEDLSTRNHTLNDVPTIIWGRKKAEIAERINDLTDLTPQILQLLS